MQVRFASVASTTLFIGLLLSGCGMNRNIGEFGPRRALVIVGGGGTPPEVVAEAITLAGGPSARITIVPLASGIPETGDESAKMFRAAGARRVEVFRLPPTKNDADVDPTIDPAHPLDGDRHLADAPMASSSSAPLRDDTAMAKLRDADLIWFPGGDQNRLMRRLRAAGVVETIQRRYREGAVIGGTSAGAAVMSGLMITGDADNQAIRRGGTKLAEGLGLWPGVIVDQHFIKRRRFNRLLAAVLDHANLLGVGIDEQTAVIVRDDAWNVMGAGNVFVIDARAARIADTNGTASAGTTGIRIGLFGAGDAIDVRDKLPAGTASSISH